MPNTDKNHAGGHSHPQKDGKGKIKQLDAQQKNASGESGKDKASKAPEEDLGKLGFKTGD